MARIGGVCPRVVGCVGQWHGVGRMELWCVVCRRPLAHIGPDPTLPRPMSSMHAHSRKQSVHTRAHARTYRTTGMCAQARAHTHRAYTRHQRAALATTQGSGPVEKPGVRRHRKRSLPALAGRRCGIVSTHRGNPMPEGLNSTMYTTGCVGRSLAPRTAPAASRSKTTECGPAPVGRRAASTRASRFACRIHAIVKTNAFRGY